MSRAKYIVGENVLCYQGQLIYDAKIIEIKKNVPEWSYQVHYKGWNKSWDEWIDDKRLLKTTAENLAKQKKLQEECDPKMKHASKRSGAALNYTDPKQPKRSNTPSSDITDIKNKGVEYARSRSNSDASIHSVKSNVSTSSSKGKAGPKSAQQNKKIYPNKNKNVKATSQIIEKPKAPRRMFGESIQLELPDNLKSVLVDDYDYMLRQRKLASIPARYNVEDLLQAYRKSRSGRDGMDTLANVDEICRGMRDYFNSALGCQLLYKFERAQYADLLATNPGVSVSKLYGPIHLLRLITKLGPMLTAADMDATSLNILVQEVTRFIQYISKHRNTLFQSDDYGTASPEYHRRSL